MGVQEEELNVNGKKGPRRRDVHMYAHVCVTKRAGHKLDHDSADLPGTPLPSFRPETTMPGAGDVGKLCQFKNGIILEKAVRDLFSPFAPEKRKKELEATPPRHLFLRFIRQFTQPKVWKEDEQGAWRMHPISETI
jgi:hypothetical protein